MVECRVRAETCPIPAFKQHPFRHSVAFGILIGERDQFGIDFDAGHARARHAPSEAEAGHAGA